MSAEWELLQGLFEGALERPTHERAAFLDAHTRNDPALRRDIESLLAAHESAGQFLSAPALGPPVDGSESPPGPHRSVSGHTRLATGASLGAFTIVDLLGSGGMGEVYRARDTRLDRQVAIKVLSSERDTAPGSRERFEREARAISRLSHPRICTVHDIGVAEMSGSAVPYLVMELLDGETLAARIARGPLSIEQSLAYAIDIADALIAAHHQRIVHRDLKPANVMLTSTGVKLLDFGLALLRMPEPAGPTAVPVSSVAGLTSGGLVMGTVPYTSPEQLRGERVDARTDLFAFGALLYEMLTGTRPFKADSQAGLIAAVLEHDAPAVADRQPLTPASLDRIVQKCLAKNPDDRWQTARDLRSELVWVRDGPEDERPARRSVVRRAKRRTWPQVMLALIPAIAVALLVVNAWRTGRPPAAPARQVMRLSLNLPPGVRLGIPVNGISFAIAPDGSRVAFLGVRDGRGSLFIHTLADGKTVDVPNTVGAGTPMFSPDSQSVAFNYAGAIRKVPAIGGPVQLLVEKGNNQMTWLPDGRIVSGGPLPLRLVGHEPRDLTRLGQGEEGHHMPVLTPDGSLLFSVIRGGYASSSNSIAVVPPDALEKREVLSNATSPRLIGPDVLVFAQGRTLAATRFDSRAVRAIGESRPLFDVQTTGYSGAPMYAVAGNGTLVYAEPPRPRRLVWVDREGREEPARTDERMYNSIRLSPDGTRVAANVYDADRNLWVFGLDGSVAMQLTSGPDRDVYPVWSRDGKEIFFTTGERNVARVPADRSTPPVTFFRLERPDRIHPLSITPDGKRLLTMWDRSPERFDLRVIALGATPTLTRLVDDSRFDQEGRLSHDGRWLVYESAESTSTAGRDQQIVVRPFPDVQAGRWVISRGTGSAPIWSRDGREIFYRANDGAVMAVPISTAPAFSHGQPVRLMTPTLTAGGGPTYDVHPDGTRFLFIRTPELDIRALTVVLNWDVEVNAALTGTGR